MIHGYLQLQLYLGSYMKIDFFRGLETDKLLALCLGQKAELPAKKAKPTVAFK